MMKLESRAITAAGGEAFDSLVETQRFRGSFGLLCGFGYLPTNTRFQHPPFLFTELTSNPRASCFER